MTERAQLNLKLPEEQKQRWKDAADTDPEYSSLSHLIRHAVERELAGGESPPAGGADSGTIDHIRETVEENRDALTGLRSVVTSIHEATDAGEERHAKAEVWSLLPESGEGMTPAEIADGIGGPFTATTVAGLLESMSDDDHVTTPNGTHYRRAAQ